MFTIISIQLFLQFSYIYTLISRRERYTHVKQYIHINFMSFKGFLFIVRKLKIEKCEKMIKNEHQLSDVVNHNGSFKKYVF